MDYVKTYLTCVVIEALEFVSGVIEVGREEG